MPAFKSSSFNLRLAKGKSILSGRNQHSHIHGEIKGTRICKGILFHGFALSSWMAKTVVEVDGISQEIRRAQDHIRNQG